MFPETVGTDLPERYREAMETGRNAVFELFSPRQEDLG
jgi:hypothetical protein